MLRPHPKDWNWWAFAPLLVLILIAIYGLVSFDAPAPPAEPSGTNQQQQVATQAKNNDPSLFFEIGRFVYDERDVILPLTGIAAVGAALWLAYLTSGLVNATRDLAVSTRALASGEQARAVETAKATELAEKQFLLAGRQADLAAKQQELQLLQFYAEHRPKLEIQFVRRLPANPDFPSEEQDIAVEFVITNIGTSEANVLGSIVRLDWMEQSEIPTPNDLTGADVIPHRRFLVGATDKAVVRSAPSGGFVEALDDEDKHLYLLGWVVYADGRGAELGSTRTTYFWREFDPESKRFKDPRLGNPGAEWEWENTQ